MSEPEHPSAESLWTGLDEAVREHLRGCPRCQDEHDRVQSEQDGVAAWLAAQPAPPPMPDAVADRVHAGLDAEVEARGVTRPAPTRHVGRWLVAAGVAGAAVVGSAVLLPMLQGSDDPLAGTDVAAESLQRTEPESADQDAAGAALLPEVPADLVLLATTPGAASARAGCGGVLAEQVGAVLLGSTAVEDDRSGVLVVLDESQGQAVWWLPTCEAGQDQALGRSLVRE